MGEFNIIINYNKNYSNSANNLVHSEYIINYQIYYHTHLRYSKTFRNNNSLFSIISFGVYDKHNSRITNKNIQIEINSRLRRI